MSNILIDILGLLKRKKIVKNPNNKDYIPLTTLTDFKKPSVKPDPKYQAGIISMQDLKTYVNSGGGGSGEVNTASNVGSGEGIFRAKVGTDLQFKSLSVGEGLNITSSSTNITIFSGYVQQQRTTDATQLTLSTSKTVDNDSVESFVTRISAMQTGGSAGTIGDVWVHEFRGAIKQLGGVTTLVDTVTDELIAEDTGASGYSVSIEPGTGTIDIKVTGELNKTIYWKAISVFNNNSL